MPHHLIPRHCGYRQLKSFQIAQLVYDITVRFATRYIDRHSRTRDQMIQAARSGNWLGVSSSPGQLPGRGPHQIRTRRFPPSGSSAGTAHGEAHRFL
jgi:hypothetical protein